MTVVDEAKVIATYGPQDKPKPRFEVKPLIPKGFETEATTPVEALLMAQAALQVEGRWVKNVWFSNPGQDENYDDPFCDSWSACAAGMLALVTVGAGRQCTAIRPQIGQGGITGFNEEQLDKQDFTWSIADRLGASAGLSESPVQRAKVTLYEKAVEFLRRGANETYITRYGVARKRHWSDVPSFNDSGMTTREDVLAAFSQGIAIAARTEVEEAIAARMVNAFQSALPNHHVSVEAF